MLGELSQWFWGRACLPLQKGQIPRPMLGKADGKLPQQRDLVPLPSPPLFFLARTMALASERQGWAVSAAQDLHRSFGLPVGVNKREGLFGVIREVIGLRS